MAFPVLNGSKQLDQIVERIIQVKVKTRQLGEWLIEYFMNSLQIVSGMIIQWCCWKENTKRLKGVFPLWSCVYSVCSVFSATNVYYKLSPVSVTLQRRGLQVWILLWMGDLSVQHSSSPWWHRVTCASCEHVTCDLCLCFLVDSWSVFYLSSK